LSIPEGRLGNIPAGLFHILCCVSQKHLGHSFIKLIAEGDSLKGMNKINIASFYEFWIIDNFKYFESL